MVTNLCTWQDWSKAIAVASASPSFWYSDHFSLGEGHPLTILAYERGDLSSDEESIFQNYKKLCK